MNHRIKLPSPADKIVTEFADIVCRIEQGFIDGIYLTGSICLNDFYPNKSDIDFVVLCKKLPDKNRIAQLKYIHRSISKHYSKPNLSGCYLATESLDTSNPESIKILALNEGVWSNRTFEMAPVSLAELKSHSITVHGANASTLPFSISIGTVKNFLHRNINSYWTKWIAQHSKIYGKKSLLFLFPRFTEWSVLGVARQLYTLNTGKIISKTEAGHYGLTHVPERFHPVIRQALEIRKDDTTYPFVKTYAIKPSFTRTQQTIECVNYLIDLFNKTYNEQHK